MKIYYKYQPVLTKISVFKLIFKINHQELKMQKSKKYLLIIIVSLLVFGVAAYKNRDVVFSNPLNINLQIESAGRISSDTAGNRFIIFNSLKKIAKIREDNRVEYILEGNSEKPESFFRAWDIINDTSDNFYLLDYMTDDSGLKIVRENVKMFTPDGDYVKTVFSHVYKEDERPDMEGNYRKIIFSNGRIFYFYNDTEKILIGSINIENGTSSILKTIPMDNPKLNIVDCDFIPNLSTIAYITKKGQIFLSEYGLQFRQIYTSSRPAVKNELSIPWQIALDGRSVFFSDAGLKKIVKMEKNRAGVYEFSFSGQSPDTIRNFKLKGDSFIAVTDDSIIEGGFNGVIKSESGGKRYSAFILASRWLIFLSGILFIINALLLIAWIYVYVFNRKLSEVTVQSAMIIAAVMVTTLIVLKIAVSTLSGIYKENVFNNLKHINQLSNKYIDGNLISKITDREDFMNGDYIKLRSQLHNIFNDNGDEWNADYYGGIYTLKDNKVYVLMFFDDSSGVNFPYKDNYKETSFMPVIDKGEITTVEENDIYGSWIYSLGPIYNSKGELTGVLEVGKDLNSFEVKIKEFITNINKEIITVLIILVLVMIEIAILRNVFIHKNEDSSNPFGKYSVEVVRMLAFIIAFSYALPISYTPLMMKKILTSSGISLFNLPETIAIAIPISAEMLATAVFAIFAGNWTEQKGWKYPFLIGSLCMAAGSFIAYYINNPYAFLIARTFVGTAYGFALVTLQCYPMISPDVSVRNRGLASQNSGLNAGYCCGVAIGGLSADYMGFSKVYIISLVVSFMAYLYAHYLMKNARTYNSGEVIKVSVLDILKFFRNRNIFMFFFTAFIPVSICSMFLTYMFPVFAESRDISAGDISRVFMMNSLIIIYLGPAIVRYLSKRDFLRGKWSMVLYMVVTLTGLILFGIKPSMITAVIIVLFVGLGDSFGLPMSNDYLIELKASADIGYDKSVGYLNFIGNIGQMIGPVLMGYLFVFGYSQGMIIMITGMTAFLFLFIIGSKKELTARGNV